MKQVSNTQDLKQLLDKQRVQNRQIGFVPTMGALHAGHAALVEKARRECDYVLVSIFVNPTQFNDKNDLLHYPRTPEADAQLLESAGCDVLFMPTVDVIYPTGFDETPLPVSLNGLDTVMEGAHRPGHFAGVMQVVNKLFQAVGSCRAYFGQKDFQQVAVIRHMTAVLQLPVTIVACPIVREVDGLAMSSRNRRLSPEERAAAPLLYKALQLAQRLWPNTPVEEIRQQVTALVETDSRFQLEYFQLVDTHSLQPVDQNQRKAVVTCIAARLGKIRLIDNLVLAE